jgi:hypothetical protein
MWYFFYVVKSPTDGKSTFFLKYNFICILWYGSVSLAGF